MQNKFTEMKRNYLNLHNKMRKFSHFAVKSTERQVYPPTYLEIKNY